MPSPIFVIAAESGSIDQRTNMLSLFNIIDSIIATLGTVAPETPPSQPILNLFVVALWRADESEIGPEFESEMLMHIPGVTEPIKILSSRFRFEKLFQRLVMHISVPVLITTSGDMKIVNKIRQTGETKWKSQSYDVIVKVEQSEAPNDQSGPGNE